MFEVFEVFLSSCYMFIDMHACDGGSERHGRGGCALEIIRVGCGGPEHGERERAVGGDLSRFFR